jgi:uncharacterized protein with ATP-grasp and redox domains
MKILMDCIPCFVKQAINAAEFLELNEEKTETIIKKVLLGMSKLDLSVAPGVMGGEIHRIIREETGNKDPYLGVKIKYNNVALELYPKLESRIDEADEPLGMAIKLAIAGNIIDFGVLDHVSTEKLDNSIEVSLSTVLDDATLKSFKEEVESAKNILYICDNAGEIVFDKFLLNLLPLSKLTVAVKGGPVINDAIMEDAKHAGLTEKYRVIDNGADYPGTVLEYCSDEFMKEYENADVIIAKGQANFECLNDENRGIYFLLRVKCPAIAIITGEPEGAVVFKKL